MLTDHGFNDHGIALIAPVWSGLSNSSPLRLYEINWDWLKRPIGDPYDFNSINNLTMADQLGKVVIGGRMLRNALKSVSGLKGLETYNPAAYAPCCCDSE